jgi:O-antigen/teichoic acid export membrane protein
VFYSQRPDNRVDVQYAGSTLVHAFALAVVGAIVLGGTAAVLAHQPGGSGLATVIRAVAGAIILIMLREYARRVSFAWRQPGIAIVMDLSAALLQISGLLLLSRLGLLSAAAAFLVTGGAFCLATLWWLGSNRKNFEFKWNAVGLDLGLNWSFGKWIVAGGLIYTARSNLYPWFLASIYGTGATATFAACMGITLFTNPFFIALSNFLGPKAAHNFANGGIVALLRAVHKTTFLVTLAMVAFTAGVLVFGERLVVLIYGSQYAGSGPIVSVLVLSLLAGAVALGFDAALYAMNRPNAVFLANVLGLSATVCAGFTLAKYYGPLGAAYGLLMASIVTTISKYISFSRLVKNDVATGDASRHRRAEVVPKSMPALDVPMEG